MTGTTDDAVADAGLDKELINYFKKVQIMKNEDKKIVIELIDAFVTKRKIQAIM